MTRTPKIVFFGTPDFAVASLDTLVKAGHDIAAVVTMPDKPAGRGKHLQQSAVKKYAVEAGLPVMQPGNLKDPSFVDSLRSIGADLFIVIAFRMLPEAVWSMPPMGTFNLHASLLPLYRGAAPINRAVMNGDTRTGVSTFLLKHEIDTGDLLCQEALEIDPDEDAGSVHDRLMALGARLTLETVDKLADGQITPVPQDTLRPPTPAPKIFKNDCRIDWTLSAAQIHNHVRGLAPYPGAWTTMADDTGNETTIKILKTEHSAQAAGNGAPGHLEMSEGKVICCTGSGTLRLVTVQPANKRPMNAADWFRGLRSTDPTLF